MATELPGRIVATSVSEAMMNKRAGCPALLTNGVIERRRDTKPDFGFPMATRVNGQEPCAEVSGPARNKPCTGAKLAAGEQKRLLLGEEPNETGEPVTAVDLGERRAGGAAEARLAGPALEGRQAARGGLAMVSEAGGGTLTFRAGRRCLRQRQNVREFRFQKLCQCRILGVGNATSAVDARDQWIEAARGWLPAVIVIPDFAILQSRGRFSYRQS